MKKELILESDLNKISSESKYELDGSKVAAGDSNMSRSQDNVQSNNKPVLRHTKQWQRCLQLLDMIVQDMHIFLALIVRMDMTSGTHWKTSKQFNTSFYSKMMRDQFYIHRKSFVYNKIQFHDYVEQCQMS